MAHTPPAPEAHEHEIQVSNTLHTHAHRTTRPKSLALFPFLFPFLFHFLSFFSSFYSPPVLLALLPKFECQFWAFCRRVVAIVVKHLEDSGTDVKQQAVRTIASLAKKVQETQLEEIADKLASHILNQTDEEKRDIGSIGLKTLVGAMTMQTAPAVLKRVTPKLQQGIGMEPEVMLSLPLPPTPFFLREIPTSTTNNENDEGLQRRLAHPSSIVLRKQKPFLDVSLP